MSEPLLPAIAEARQRFMDLVAEVRPELHRYSARMTGSVFDGEDVVQDTLAKAYFALGQMEEAPPLRPWLFRIAHNTAMDFLRRYEHKNVDVVAEVPDATDTDEPGADPALVEAALTLFASLPPRQRSALALKDVLGHSLEEVATTMDTTVAAVKAALVRARTNIVAARPPAPATLHGEDRERLQRYADLFNARNWDALRAQFAEEARLDVVARTQRRGPGAAQYYTRYAEIIEVENLRAEPGAVDGVPVIAIYRPASSPTPAYFVQVHWHEGRIALIRDFRYVPYITDGARFTR